jgi:hypothetical protein
MTDLTAITTPWGLLDDATREALKAHGGPYEHFHECGAWEAATTPQWSAHRAYRVKPQPPKPREWWLLDQVARNTEAEAIELRAECDRISPDMGFLAMPIIHVREVIE